MGNDPLAQLEMEEEQTLASSRLELSQQRGQTHGDYTNMSRVIQSFKRVYHSADNYNSLSDTQKEALDLIATKIGRIVTGDPNCRDHWQDIIGYTQLALDRIGHKAYHAPENGD